MVGTALTDHLRDQDYEVVRLVRREAAEDDEISWDPDAGKLDPEALNGIKGVVNLSGYSIAGGIWTKRTKRLIRESRIKSTNTIAAAISSADKPPEVLVSASAVGYYGDCGEDKVTEQHQSGVGFLAGVCKDWEQAAAAAEAYCRVARIRTGLVLSADGGLLSTMLMPFKLGLGGPLGDGQQFMSWVAISDLVRIIEFVLRNERLAGPVNAAAPNPVRNKVFTEKLAATLKRPAFFRVPEAVLKSLPGGMGQELMLSSVRAEPDVLESTNFEFNYPKLDACLRDLLNKP